MPDLGFQPTVPKRQKLNRNNDGVKHVCVKKGNDTLFFKTVAPTAVYCQP